jgi:glycerol-3-phosphate acyltransferase PlsX
MEKRNMNDKVTDPVVLALDAEGGDNAPGEVVAGALLAASPSLRVLLIGRPSVIEAHLRGADTSNVEIVPSASVVSSYQEPASAVRNMQDSSIVVGARTVADGRSQGFVSAGSTGAMLAASVLIMKRVDGIKRPAILTAIPALGAPLVFLDAGANADCRPEHLLEFGVLGAAYARAVLGQVEPRVGLLNIGEEEGKGNELAIGAHALLKKSGLNFVGNVEGRDLLTNMADVVVTDGFTGNVTLKVLEGCSVSLFTRIRQAAQGGALSKTGGMLLRPALRGVRADLDPEAYGGAYLLGVRGLSVICHGNSSRVAIANALKFGADALRKGVLQAVEREVATILGNPEATGKTGSE